MTTVPSPTGSIKLSCFSAVTPVMGWNQWVKWVAPFSRAHCFMASAISFAAESSSWVPFDTLFFHA